MSTTILFKQSFKPRASPSTPGLNVAHLQYIATRPGAVYNKSCGFGLWGQLPGDSRIQIQTDLERAKQLVRTASEQHTLYRAILSVGKDDAEQFGLYDRAKWENLVNAHMQDIAKQMDIQPENLRWCASMHQAKNHPHVHILYWDDSNDPRRELMPKAEFSARAERIRGIFAGDLHREEIRELQKGQREQSLEMRRMLQALIRETNPEKSLDLGSLLQSKGLDPLVQQMGALVRESPASGSLDFAFLPPAYKEKVLALVEDCLNLPELASEWQRYETCTRQIGTLYANGEETVSRNLAKAQTKLRKELANSVMNVVRDLRRQIWADAPEEAVGVWRFVKETATQIVPDLPSYQALQEYLAEGDLNITDNSWTRLNAVVQDAMSDTRVRLRMQSYAIHTAGIDLDRLPAAGRQAQHVLCGRQLSQQDWWAYNRAFHHAEKSLRNAILDQLGRMSYTVSDGDTQKLLRDIQISMLPTLVSYQNLQDLLPQEWIPAKAMEIQIDGFHNAMNQVIRDILVDDRVKRQFHTNALRRAGIDLDSLPDMVEDAHRSGPSTLGKVLTPEQQERYQEAYRQEKRELRNAIREQLCQDAGWTGSMIRYRTASMVCNMMRLLSQAAGQQNCATQMHRSLRLSRDKSKEQRRDEQAQKQLSEDYAL